MKTITLILFLSLILSCSAQKEEYLLNEEFNENVHGWVEETTEAHQTELLDGKLVIMSLDTAASFSSNGPRDASVFWSLPKSWEFTTAMEVIDGGPEVMVDLRLDLVFFCTVLPSIISLALTERESY